ncbi:MAG: hypothetical protein WCG27_12710, partial [Pseudomonadota bacterium]
MIIYSLAIFYSSFSYFWLHFDKIILLLNAAYLVFAFYFHVSWSNELSQVIYSPGFGPFHFGRRSPYPFDVQVEFDEEQKFAGHLTNWSENSCFIVLDQVPPNKAKKIKINIPYEGNIFMAEGEWLSSFGERAIGIQIKEIVRSQEIYTWKA